MTVYERILRYAKRRYSAVPDHPFSRSPEAAVLRHGDSGKWFALMMEVPREKLGLKGDGKAQVMNVKTPDPLLADLLMQQKGYFRAYHMKARNWITVLLDGTVPYEDVCRALDESFHATAPGNSSKKPRPPKEWIIPANPRYYDVEHAFDTQKEIFWKQGKGIRTGDTVYMYTAAPVSAILYRCRVTGTDFPCDHRGGELRIDALMKIRLQKRYDPGKFTFERLKRDYGIAAVRGPRGIPYSLGEALKR